VPRQHSNDENVAPLRVLELRFGTVSHAVLVSWMEALCQGIRFRSGADSPHKSTNIEN
jgi:hypothetical protein